MEPANILIYFREFATFIFFSIEEKVEGKKTYSLVSLFPTLLVISEESQQNSNLD